jgi:hypothetical protein
MPSPLFCLGETVATPAVIELGVDLLNILGRHWTGDWGELSEADKLANRRAVVNGSRILSAYTVTASGGRKVRVWIITEADRSVTTFLLPSEY